MRSFFNATQGGDGSAETTILFASSIASVTISLFAVAAVSFLGQICNGGPDLSSSKEGKTELGDPKYDLKLVKAPVASGSTLKFLSKILSSRYWGHFLRRNLLNSNDIHLMRELAAQATAACVPLVTFPMYRKTTEEIEEEEDSGKLKAGVRLAARAVKKGLTISRPTKEDLIGHPNGPSNGSNTTNGAQQIPPSSNFPSILDYYRAYCEQDSIPSEMIERVLNGLDKLEGLNMFVSCDREDCLRQARRSDIRWAANNPFSVFDGVPVTVKDSINVKGYRTTKGKAPHESDPVATRDDLLVKRLRDAGAIILGKTVMTEIGRCPVGYNSHVKGPFNPYNEKHYSGGSSSGSAVSVATGLVPISVGFDGGGSIRIPAAFSGLFGLAPTFGRVPFDDVSHCTSTVIRGGPLAATTTDAALTYALLASEEPDHFYSRLYGGSGPPAPHLTGYTDIQDLTGIRIGIFSDYMNDCDEQVLKACKSALESLTKRGATIVEVTVPHLQIMGFAHATNIASEILLDCDRSSYERSDWEPGTEIFLGLGRSMSAVELQAANRVRGWGLEHFKTLYREEIDVFLSPTTPIVAPEIPAEAKACGESNTTLTMKIMRYIFLANLLGFPGMSVPVGYEEKTSLPIGLHLMADHWNEAILLRLSHCLEKFHLKRQRPKHFHENLVVRK